MIKNKKIQDGVILCSYDSTNVIASSYNQKEGKLTITFKKGVQYHYDGITFDEYQMLENADSQGKMFRTVVKDKLFEKGETVDSDKLLLEITTPSTDGEIIKTELDKDEVQFVSIMESFLIKHNKKHDLELSGLNDIKYFLEKVIKNKENE